MCVPFLKSILEKTELTIRCLVICSGLLLFVQGVQGGVYQRTKDGKTLVWNNFPTEDDLVSWTGKRDAEGFATGAGTLTWYRVERVFQTGSLIPWKGPVTLVTRYSGTMVRGKLDGPVVNVDPDGKTSRLIFANGTKNSGRSGQSAPAVDQSPTASAPAEGPASRSANSESAKELSPKKTTAESPAANRSPPTKASSSPSPEKPTLEIASLKPKGPATAAPASDGIDQAVKDRIISDFREETRSVLSQVAEATDNFGGVDGLNSVEKLPGPVSENVSSLVARARDFRSKVGYETALREYRTETETVDALAAIDQVTRNIASNDSSAATAKLTEFLKANPEPSADDQKALWQYLGSIQQLCSRSEKDAEVHLHRAESFAAASRTSEAIREYQEAYRIFPNPATAEKIRQLQTNSLGL